jgi:holliday junction DNA helicase RuvB
MTTSQQRTINSLRPTRLDEVIGQRTIVAKLRVLLSAARKLGEPLPHILFDSPGGLGKSSLATLLPHELGVSFQLTSGPALSKPSDVMPLLTSAEDRSVIVLDEAHRLSPRVQEFLYSAMEDFRVDVVRGEGVCARTLSVPLKRFGLIACTTRSGLISGPMRDRFIHGHLEYYSVEELTDIVLQSSFKLSVPIDSDAAVEIAKRGRGTPRIVNSLLTWARSFAISEGDGWITRDLVLRALAMAEIDGVGMDKRDKRYLETLVVTFNGGPVGSEAIAANMNLTTETVSEEIEPFLLREQLIARTPRGRVATRRGLTALGYPLGHQPRRKSG